MYFYHNTNHRTEILKKQKIKVRDFSYFKYLNYVISYVSCKDIIAGKLPSSYPNCHNNAPYMGSGIYCFEKKDDAIKYESGSVITIVYDDDATVINLDDPKTLYSIYLKLSLEGNKCIDKLPDKEAKKKWKLLLQLIINNLLDKFERGSTIIIGVFAFFWKEIMERQISDVYKKKFHDILSSDLGPFCLINNTNKILNYC